MNQLLPYIISFPPSFYVFWILAKEEGFIDEDIFDLSFFLIFAGVLFRILSAPVYGFLGSLILLILFVKIKRWSLKKVGDTIIIPFVLFLCLLFAFNAIMHFSGYSLILSGIFVLMLGFLVYLRKNYFFGVSAKKAGTSRFFGTFLSGFLFYLGLILVCLTVIIFLQKDLFEWVVYLSLFVWAVIGIIMETRKEKNSKMIKEQIIDRIKAQLLKKKEALEKEEKLIDMEDSYKVAGRDSDNADILGDVGEDVSHEITMSTLGVIKKIKEQVGKALARIRTGKYGICEKCGKKIDPARMKAYPETTLCLTCSHLS